MRDCGRLVMLSRLGPFAVCVLFLSTLSVCPLAHGDSPMVEKNLFAPERRPDVAESPAPSAPGSSDAALRSLQLDAVMVFGENRRAILRSTGRRAPQGGAGGEAVSPYVSVKEGDQVGDFKVVKIEPRSIRLEKEGQLHELSLFAAGKVVPPPPPSPDFPQADVTEANGDSRPMQRAPQGVEGVSGEQPYDLESGEGAVGVIPEGSQEESGDAPGTHEGNP